MPLGDCRNWLANEWVKARDTDNWLNKHRRHLVIEVPFSFRLIVVGDDGISTTVLTLAFDLRLWTPVKMGKLCGRFTLGGILLFFSFFLVQGA